MKVVALNGSLRRNSSNAALLAAAARLAPPEMTITLDESIGNLPHFNPDLDEDRAPEAVESFRRALLECDGVLISSPEYAHGVPGAFKNALDWLVSVGELVDTPVLLMNASPHGCRHAQQAIAETLRTMNWSLVDASLTEPFLQRKLSPTTVPDEEEATAIRRALTAFAEAIEKRRRQKADRAAQ